jgi:hypothetical protein
MADAVSRTLKIVGRRAGSVDWQSADCAGNAQGETVVQRIAQVFTAVACLGLVASTSVTAQEPDTVLELLLAIIDDTTCGDAVGRTYRTATLFSSSRNDDAAGFFARHESCAGVSGRAADAGLTPLPVGLIAQCSDAVELPGWNYEWFICDLGFSAMPGLTAPIHIELGDFHLMTGDDQKIAPYVLPDLYAGQMHDISGGLDFAGPDPAFGTIAFPVYPDQVDGPFVIAWEKSGDFIIADELEPATAEHFIRDMQA